jgi:D5-like protein
MAMTEAGLRKTEKDLIIGWVRLTERDGVDRREQALKFARPDEVVAFNEMFDGAMEGFRAREADARLREIALRGKAIRDLIAAKTAAKAPAVAPPQEPQSLPPAAEVSRAAPAVTRREARGIGEVARKPGASGEVEAAPATEPPPAALPAVVVAAPSPVRFGGERPATNDEPASISQMSPYDTAKEYVRRFCFQQDFLATYFWQDEFWEWNGRYYEVVPNGVMQDRLFAFLDDSWRFKDGERLRFKPTPRNVNDVLACLKAGLVLPAAWQPPMWIGGAKATDILVFQNGLVNVMTGERLSPTPRLWVHGAVDYDWQPEAGCPIWEAFLEEVFPGDPASRDCIEELLGYAMTEETKLQKGALIILISNEVPNLNDVSGVLPSRFIKIAFNVSFFGREDVDLRGKLAGELPGIANRCLAAYRRLIARGRFAQPDSGRELEQTVQAQADPYAAMVQEVFVIDPAGTVKCDFAFLKFDGWCREHGRHDVLRSTPRNLLTGRLKQVPGLEALRTIKPHGEPRIYVGLRLKTKADRERELAERER